jgi:hypothetical protein
VSKLVEFQKRVKSRLHHLLFQKGLSLYDQCLFAFALGPTVPLPAFREVDLQAARSWGILLSGSQFCAEVHHNRTLILSLRKLISLGNDQKGDEHVDSFIRTALTISSTAFEHLNKLVASLRSYKHDDKTGDQWLFHRSWTATVGILSLVSNICFLHHKFTRTQAYPTPLKTGECWQTVFGDLYAVDLSYGFSDLDLLHIKLEPEYFGRQHNRLYTDLSSRDRRIYSAILQSVLRPSQISQPWHKETNRFSVLSPFWIGFFPPPSTQATIMLPRSRPSILS